MKLSETQWTTALQSATWRTLTLLACTLVLISVVNDKPVCDFCSFLAKITKFNIWEPVIENVIIVGHLMADTSSKQQKIYLFCEICYIFT